MTQTDKFALLRDLAHLVRKYGPTVFSDLAGFLRNPETVAELVTILEAAETAGRKSRVTASRAAPIRGKGARGNLQHLLSDLEKDEPEKAQVLSGLYESLAAKRALLTLRELRSFARDYGLKAVSATSRDKAISPLLRDLAARPIEDIRSILGHISTVDTAGDRTLEAWTDVILSKQRSRGGS